MDSEKSERIHKTLIEMVTGWTPERMEINRSIAELRGWTQLKEASIEDGSGSRSGWIGRRPDGMPVALEATPDYARNPVEALNLFAPGEEVKLWRNELGYHARRDFTGAQACGLCYAEAVAKAWLEQQAEVKPTLSVK